MHFALWQLLSFDFRGGLRGLLSIRRNWRQLFLLLLMLGFVAFFLIARATSGSAVSSGVAGRFGPAMPFWSLLYLLATWLTASADRGLVMRPAEIHFLVGGPFPDRDVVTFNLIRLAFRALVSSLVLSLLAMAYVASYPSALVGMWLLISVSLLVGMIASLAARRAQAAWLKHVRRIFTVAAIATLLVLISQSMEAVRAKGETPQIPAIAAAALETSIGKVILPPLAWMFAPLGAESFVSETLMMLPSRIGVLLGLIGLIYVLSGRYLEASTRRTDLSIAKRQSALRSGVSGVPGKRGWASRLSVPLIGRFGGVGTVAWMQMQHALRVLPRFLVFTVAIVGVVLVLPMTVDRQRLEGVGTVAWMIGLTLYADFLLLLQLPVGFLGPVAQRESFKSLPIPVWRVVLGMLAGPVIPLAIVHCVVLALFLYLVPGSSGVVLATFFALIPGALVLIANINLLGSWNIIRPRALQQRDALAAGRAMASVWVFFAMLTPAAASAGVGAGVFGWVFGGTMIGYLLGGAIGAAASSLVYIALLTRSFARWQPTAAEAGKEETELDR